MYEITVQPASPILWAVLDAGYCYTCRTFRGLCVCQSDVCVLVASAADCAKTTELIVMQTRTRQRNHIRRDTQWHLEQSNTTERSALVADAGFRQISPGPC